MEGTKLDTLADAAEFGNVVGGARAGEVNAAKEDGMVLERRKEDTELPSVG
jgi:hypothetical protein